MSKRGMRDSRAIDSLRLTGQLTPRNRVSFSHEYQHRCSGSTLTLSGDGCRQRDSDRAGTGSGALGTRATSPESFPGYHDFPYNVTQATWSSPLTSRCCSRRAFPAFSISGPGSASPRQTGSPI